jgi:uncharacterized protein (UPF0548 family)
VLATRLLGIRFAEPVRGVFTARSISRPAGWFWRLGTPALRMLQRSVFRRYIRIVRAEIAAVR